MKVECRTFLQRSVLQYSSQLHKSTDPASLVRQLFIGLLGPCGQTCSDPAVHFEAPCLWLYCATLNVQIIFISGHVDLGESEFETALRETAEEAGLTKEQLDIMDSFQSVLHYEAFGKPKKVVFWLSQLKDPDFPVTLSEEHIDFKWVPLEEACSLVQFEDMEKAVREADNFISKSLT